MDDLTRGLGIFTMRYLHGHDLAIWIAILTPILCGWFAIWTSLQKKKNADADDSNLRPRPRAPLPGPDRGFR